MKRSLPILGLVLVVIAVVGCGAVGASKVPGEKDAQSGTTAFVSSAPVATPAPAPARAATDTKGGSNGGTINVTERMIIRNGNITLIVKDVTESMGAVTAIANDAGGLVLSSSTRHQNDQLIATVTIKVPVESFDATIARLRELAIKVDAESTSSQDVTEEYVDLEARLKVYEATEQQLLKFMDRTQNVDEALKVQRELSNVRAQIESLKGRMNYLAKSAAMSTIVVQLHPEPKEKPIIEEKGWNPGRVLRAALRALVLALQGLANAAIWLVLVVLPIAIIIGVVLLVVRAIWRRLRRRPER